MGRFITSWSLEQNYVVLNSLSQVFTETRNINVTSKLCLPFLSVYFTISVICIWCFYQSIVQRWTNVTRYTFTILQTIDTKVISSKIITRLDTSNGIIRHPLYSLNMVFDCFFLLFFLFFLFF